MPLGRTFLHAAAHSPGDTETGTSVLVSTHDIVNYHQPHRTRGHREGSYFSCCPQAGAGTANGGWATRRR